MKLPFQLAVAASQPAATVANLLPFETAAGIQPPFQTWFVAISVNVKSEKWWFVAISVNVKSETMVRGYFCQC
jgi:hypothetical protein